MPFTTLLCECVTCLRRNVICRTRNLVVSALIALYRNVLHMAATSRLMIVNV